MHTLKSLCIAACCLLMIPCVFSSGTVSAQEVYVHISHSDIYDFLDELANAGIIEINSAVKPYSRIYIAKRLDEASRELKDLNKRQQQELDFYLKDYGKELHADRNFDRRKDLFYYKDSLFTFTFNPILGLRYSVNDSGSFYHRWSGAEAWAYAGAHFGFYASLRDNHESKILSDPSWLNREEAMNYKPDTKGGGDYDEVRGGISYAWNWGSVALVKDHTEWGDNYHGSNILSGHNPSYTFLKLHMNPVRWFDFNYIHGWLVSDVIDSSRTYSIGQSNRIVFQPKFIAANLFTFIPWKRLQLSVGNSIIYSDQNVHPAYLIPFLFYKSVDHSLSSSGSNFLGQNSQLFFNISSRNIKNVHLYSSLFVDEVALGRALKPKEQTNFISFKAGVRLSNFLLDNAFLTAEYTQTNPITYRHYLISATYATSDYNLGHYLGDNSREVYLSIGYKPLSKLMVDAWWMLAQKGYEYKYNGISGDPSGNGKGLPLLSRVYWQDTEAGIKARYQWIHDVWVVASFTRSDIHGMMENEYTMPWMIGKQNTITFGVNLGF